MKVGIFYDWLNQWGGAERVLQDILEIYPQADIYTLYYQPKNTSWLPPGYKIFSLNLKNQLIYTPIYVPKIEQIDLSPYDIFISTTSTVGHSFLTQPHTLYLCYFHNINRYLYQNPPKLLKPILNIYQNIDKIYSKRPDYLLCNSQNVQQRIKIQYQRPAEILSPGIDLQKFIPNHKKPADYFLLVSRLVPHKKIDLAIKTFQKLPYKLKILGHGRYENYLKCLAANNKNIEFIDQVNESQLVSLYQNCLGLIHPQEEDFGLSALEVQACGRGVIAYNRGGAKETVIPNKTGILFEEQNESSLRQAIGQYLLSPPNPKDCRLQASRFDRKFFMLHFKQLTESLWQQHLLHTTL